MAVTLKLTDVDPSGVMVTAYGTATFSGNYATGGDTLDWTQLETQLGNQGQSIPSSFSGVGPVQAFFDSQKAGSGGSAGGYYEPVLGTAANNWKLCCYAAGGAEVSAGGYPSTVTGDVVIWQATFRKLQ